MSGIQIRDLSAYAKDPGTGIRIEAGPQWVEIGVTWDGSERWTCRIDPEVLQEIVREAEDWDPPCTRPHVPPPSTYKDLRDAS